MSAVDEAGKNQVDVLEVGDIWYFPKGSAHTIQGKTDVVIVFSNVPLTSLGLEDENEYLLVFDDGKFSKKHVLGSS